MSSLHIRSQLSVALQVTPKPAGEHTSISTYIYMNMYEIYKFVLMPLYIHRSLDHHYLEKLSFN